MKISSIDIYKTPVRYNNENNTNINFMRVDKGMARFYEANEHKFPLTVKNFLDGQTDKFQYTPLEAQREAFKYLSLADNIQDVKDVYDKEPLFKNLKKLQDTNTTIGTIYRDFKEIYENGILKSGEDFSIYLLKKIFFEAKTYDEMNQDLKTDLIEDIKNEFVNRVNKRKEVLASKQQSDNDKKGENKNNSIIEFIQHSTLRALGIQRPNQNYENSLRQTEEEYNKRFRESCSEGQTNRWKDTTKEERCDKTAHLREYSANQSDEEKEAMNTERARKLAERWQNLSQQERVDFIEKIKAAQQHRRYAMIDTWNNSIELIRELSKFLAAKQIYRPVDVIFEDLEFRVFQSENMTEFWALNRDLAEDFGQKLSLAIAKVDEALKNGTFEDLKEKIELEREQRKQMLDREKLIERKNVSKAEPSKIKDPKDREAFKNAYKHCINKDMILPLQYVNNMADIMFDEAYPKMIKKVIAAHKSNIDFIEYLIKAIKIRPNSENYEKAMRMQRAMEAAISKEMYAITRNSAYFSMEIDNLISEYRNMMHDYLPRNKYPDVIRIQRFYEEYKKSLTDKQLSNIAKRYFLYMDSNNEKQIADYINLFGRSAQILFSDKGEFPNKVKVQFNEKFLKLMPDEVKNICVPILSTPNDIVAEDVIQQVRAKIAKRFDFMPKDFLYAYTYEVADTIRTYRHIPAEETRNLYSIKNFEENVCISRTSSEGSYKYLKIPKIQISRDNKIKILAAEQALADELYRVTENQNIYSCEIEESMNICEALSMYMDVADKDGNAEYSAKEKPNKYNIRQKYNEYVNELSELADDIFEENEIKDVEKLLSVLNSDSKIGNDYTRNRIEVYIDEPGRQPIKSIAELKK